MSNSDTRLNIHTILSASRANGPGSRAVVWTQGCSIRCPGCCNPLTHSHEPRILVQPQRLANAILNIPDIEGLTISGGEPFEQPKPVALLCHAVRKAGLSVMLFTGRRYEQLIETGNQAIKHLLSQIDILVDGPFIESLTDSQLLWRGSSNQRIRLLTNRYSSEVLANTSQPQVEAEMPTDNSLKLTGFPEHSDMDILNRQLRNRGILLKSL